MINIIIATHGKMSEGVVDAVETIFGMKEGLSVVSLFSDKSADELGRELKEQIKSVSEGDGVVILTDLVSATPYNQSMLAIKELPEPFKKNTYLIGGVNLPMVLEAVNQRMLGVSISEAVDAILQTAKTSISKWSIHDFDDADDDDF